MFENKDYNYDYFYSSLFICIHELNLTCALETYSVDDDANSDFLIPISLHFNVRDLRYFRSNNVALKYQRLTPSGCKDIAI